jgi:uncharacterized membrane protein
MTAIFIIALILYVFFGMLYTDVFTLAPIFLAVALICLFFMLKRGLSELHTLNEFLKKENDKDKEESDFESTDESEK